MKNKTDIFHAYSLWNYYSANKFLLWLLANLVEEDFVKEIMQFTRKGHVLNSVNKVRNTFVPLCTYHLDMEYLFIIFYIYNYVFSSIRGVMVISIKHPAICSCGYVNVLICSLNKLRTCLSKHTDSSYSGKPRQCLVWLKLRALLVNLNYVGLLVILLLIEPLAPPFYCITLFKAWKCTLW